ncbi:MAG TPA: hypothetical protein VGD99_05265 [Anaerolineae bacterium]
MDALIIFGFFFILFCIGWGIPYIIYKLYKKNKHPWQALASRFNMRFIPESFLNVGASVVGNYRGYSLVIDSFTAQVSQKQGMLFTRLTISDALSARHKFLLKDKDYSKQKVTATELDGLLSLTDSPYDPVAEFRIKEDPRKIIYAQPGFETNLEFFQSLLDRLCDLLDGYPALTNLGGEIVPKLQALVLEKNQFQQVCLQILENICEDTKDRLRDRTDRLLCHDCLTRYGAHKVNISRWQSLVYYGCRICGQSREFFEGKVIAILDDTMEQSLRQQDQVLRVNWSTRRILFDFDEIEIVQATDKEVERFVIQVGNDTDPVRRSKYHQIPCRIGPNCNLSKNTKRILERTFSG